MYHHIFDIVLSCSSNICDDTIYYYTTTDEVLPATKAKQIKQPWKHPEHSEVMQAFPVVEGLAFRKEQNMSDYIHP